MGDSLSPDRNVAFDDMSHPLGVTFIPTTTVCDVVGAHHIDWHTDNNNTDNTNSNTNSNTNHNHNHNHNAWVVIIPICHGTAATLIYIVRVSDPIFAATRSSLPQFLDKYLGLYPNTGTRLCAGL
mmetsp:Transcript_46789/g.53150  ORF Transcript_46789/g.53150 Transcript_46789/m.53150 type:complete len:125 (+) Transcript_46789:388-762(+)